MLKIQKFDLLVALYIFCIMVAELMGSKTFPLAKIFGFQLNASVAIFVIPFLFTINDIITEVFGRERARSVVQSGMIIIFLVLVVSLLFTALPPSMRFRESESAYDDVFGKSARIAAASLTAFTIAGFLDIYIFSRLRQRLGKHALWLRNNVSNFIAQFFDTTLFIFLAFYALNRPFSDNATFLFGLIIPYWLLKCAMSIIETPFVYAGVRWLRSGDDTAETNAVEKRNTKRKK
jgi:queuosine precursor transporter